MDALVRNRGTAPLVARKNIRGDEKAIGLLRNVTFLNGTSMIGLRQEKKALLTRSGGAREKFFRVLLPAVFASRRLFLLDAEPDIHLLSQPRRPPQTIEIISGLP